jgi:hypothetical protein
MQNKVVQLDKVVHANLKVINKLDLAQATQGNMVPVILPEMAKLSTELPLVFLKNGDSGKYSCVAIMGVEAKKNLMISEGQWTGHYVPAMLTFAPLGIVAHPEDPNQVVVVINEASECLSDTEGEALFASAQEPSEFLTNRITGLTEFRQYSDITEDFVDTLVSLNLLELQEFNYNHAGQEKSVRGMYMIPREKIDKLSADKLQLLHQKGYLSAAYHHIASSYNFNKLVARL